MPRSRLLLVMLAAAACRHPAPPAASSPLPGGVEGVHVALRTGEADAALRILRARQRGDTPSPADWTALRESEGYRALHERERAMGVPFTDSAFAAFLQSDTLLARTDALADALAAYRGFDVNAAARRALSYLPAGARIAATLYLTIKPRTNSFVFTAAGGPSIFIYVNPAVTPAKLANTVTHELHHIGLSAACGDDEASAARSPAVRNARRWMGAFGEGVAMLAAAGGPDIDPHAASDSAERAVWTRDYARWREDLPAVQRFFERVLTGELATDAEIVAAARPFYGTAQGPWYTVGYAMATTIERALGREALVTALCDPALFLERYDTAADRLESTGRAAPGSLPRWPASLIAQLRRR